MRDERARDTRRRLVASAVSLFLEAGYAATSLAAVARDAGVSADTVYKTFGSKIGLLTAALDDTVGGDDAPVALLDREGPVAVRDATDQRLQVAMLAEGVTGQLERIRPLDDILRSAAAVDPQAAALREDVQVRQRREAMRVIVGWIAARGPLRDGQSTEAAALAVWTLTSPEVHLLMRDHGGCSPQEYRQWLERTLGDTLIGHPDMA